MNFRLAFIVGGAIATFILIISLIIFARAYMRLRERLSYPVRRSLFLMGAAGSMIVLVGFTAAVAVILIDIWLVIFSSLIINSEVSLLSDDADTRFIGTVSSVVVTFLVVLLKFIVPELGALLAGPLLVGMFGVAFLLGIKLVLASPSPFSISLNVLLISMISTYVLASTGILGFAPEYFIIIITPVVVPAAIFAGMSRPWRYMVVLSIVFLALSVGMSMTIVSYLSNEPYIYAYVLAAAAAALAALYPLNYFLEQASITGARTPAFIAATQVAICLLVITHSIAWAIAWNHAIAEGLTIADGVWDVHFLFVDWVLGVAGVSCLLLAAISTSGSEKTISITIDSLIFIGFALIVLGHPFVRAEKYELALLYMPLAVLIVIASGAFIRVAVRMKKAGSTSAAARFIMFIFASLGAGLAAMFSDMMWMMWPPLVLSIMVVVAFMLLASSPTGFRTLTRLQSPTIPSLGEDDA